ncbi:hypothetical protein, partial [Klebsiella pneumoniae]|uniref:hypothetical protein n=1 Tax=Klebsiella pneumoniae TaxID=573 RepID=UPI001E301992
CLTLIVKCLDIMKITQVSISERNETEKGHLLTLAALRLSHHIAARHCIANGEAQQARRRA